MGFKIVTGSAGSGKTNRIFKDLIEHSKIYPDVRHLVITPDQSSLITERRLLAMNPSGVLYNIEVLGFTRLAAHIFDELELPLPKTIDEVGKGMLVRKAVTENRSKLSLYRSAVDKEGFIHKVKVLISELLMYDVSSEMLETAAKGADSPYLAAKLKDMSICLSAFNKARNKTQITSEELLVLLLAVIGESRYFDGACVVLDGFTGFSPVHYRIIDYIFSRAAQLTVTLTIPSDENAFSLKGNHELFALTKETFLKLQKLGQEHGLKLEHEVVSDYADIGRPEELLFLEKNFLRPGKPESFAVKNPDAIRIFSCRSTAEQATFIAQTILRLVCDEGYRYKDFAVVSGNLEQTDYLFSKAFARYGIPCFIDRRKNELTHPLVVLILSALEAAENNFAYTPVMRMLRTGLVTDDEAMLDELDNYIIACGIRGAGKWSQPFTKTYRGHQSIDLEALNSFRAQLITPLLLFADEFSRAKAPGDIVSGIERLLEAYEVKEKLNKIKKKFSEAGDQIAAQNYERIYDSVIKVIGESSDIITSDKISLGKYRKILTSGFAELTEAMLPPALDQVSIGDIKRSRRGYIRILFFADMNEGVIPKASGVGGIFSDSDRRNLYESGIELAPTSTDSMFMDQFYIYETLATPTDRLYLTYPLLDSGSNSLVKSMYIERIAALFDGLKAEEARLQPVAHEDAFAYFAQECRAAENNDSIGYLVQLYNYLHNIDPERTETIAEAANFKYEPEKIPQDIMDRLYADGFKVSASELETYADCPYRGHVEYSLGLKKREEYTFSIMKRGSFFHKVFETAFNKIATEKIDIKTIDDSKRKELVEEGFKAAVSEVNDYNLAELNVDAYLLDKWRRDADKALWAMLEQLKENSFAPVKLEYKFSTKELGEPVELDNGKRMDISGKIDRVDLRNFGGKNYAAVLDYKSSVQPLDIKKVSNGTCLQLPLYLHYAIKMLKKDFNIEAIAGKMGYQAFIDVKADGSLDDEEQKSKQQLLKIYEPKGKELPVLSGNPESDSQEIENLIKTAQETIVRLGNEISEGVTEIRPLNPDKKEGGSCEFCIMKDCCRRNKKTEKED